MHGSSDRLQGVPVNRRTVTGSLAYCVLASCALATCALAAVPPRAAHAKNGDTHVIGQGIEQTVDCNNSTLLVNGTRNTITALGNCYAVTVMGSSNTVVAESVSHDITVYGWDETVLYHGGQPFIWDRGRELGMTNRLQQVPG